MSFLAWMAVIGALLLTMALASAYIRRLPVSTAVIYLVAGVAIGPVGLDWVRIDLPSVEAPFEHVTEIAVILALFIGGLKLRLPPRDCAWWAAYRLAGPVMLVSIAGVAAVAHLFLGVDLPTALLVGAVLAPTDPVLASAVSVNDARDHDRMRYGLSGEAGLNDGMAFPFVVFALLWAKEGGAGTWIGAWAAHRLLWAIPAALALGFVIGKYVGRLAIRLRHSQRDTSAPSDFLALAIIALAYVGAQWIGAWGFLSVFAAGVGLRRAEAAVVKETPHPDVRASTHPPAEHLVGAKVDEEALKEPATAAGVLVGEIVSFGDTAERLVEVLLVVIVGVLLVDNFDVRGIPLALALFVVIRPAATLALLRGTPTSMAQRGLMGWFGVRGVGSLYYLGYAITHGTEGPAAHEAAGLSITVVALSVVLHGISAAPILAAYERSLRRSPRRKGGSAAKTVVGPPVVIPH